MDDSLAQSYIYPDTAVKVGHHLSIHPFPVTAYPSQGARAYPERGYTMDKLPVHHRVNTERQTGTPFWANWDTLNRQVCA